jgi:hypothetical protein
VGDRFGHEALVFTDFGQIGVDGDKLTVIGVRNVQERGDTVVFAVVGPNDMATGVRESLCDGGADFAVDAGHEGAFSLQQKAWYGVVHGRSAL